MLEEKKCQNFWKNHTISAMVKCIFRSSCILFSYSWICTWSFSYRFEESSFILKFYLLMRIFEFPIRFFCIFYAFRSESLWRCFQNSRLWAKKVNDKKPLAILAKLSNLDICQDSKYTCGLVTKTLSKLQGNWLC